MGTVRATYQHSLRSKGSVRVLHVFEGSRIQSSGWGLGYGFMAGGPDVLHPRRAEERLV